jgi:hypothetical protein
VRYRNFGYWKLPLPVSLDTYYPRDLMCLITIFRFFRSDEADADYRPYFKNLPVQGEEPGPVLDAGVRAHRYDLRVRPVRRLPLGQTE